MVNLLQHIKDRVQGKIPRGKARSSRWPTIRKAHLLREPNCRGCGGTKKLEVHHIKPFHTHPELEEDPNNLATLCESGDNGMNCHLLLGHRGNFRSINVGVLQDADTWKTKILDRPKL